ncbi:hypothetical protein [Shewanella aestuarii]|uniref:DUF1311 domain-containing protein n=1 Tax=Shewanella aestuarii TaxID=1028752 RepID=A0A6G9QRH2_9GAMM|nr:hypothetical protein [Shewanella aestuarii]QIR16645.1 hypothetical protein HBH39_19420 [Shewanella aestuarii]
MKLKLLALSLLTVMSSQVSAESAYLGSALTKINDCYYRVKVDSKAPDTIKLCKEAERFLESNLPNIKRDMNGANWTKSDDRDLEKLSVRHKQIRLTLGTYKPQPSSSDMKELGLVAIYSRFCDSAINKDRASALSDKNCVSFLAEYDKNYDAIKQKMDSQAGFTEIDADNWSKVSNTLDTIKAIK